MYLTIGLNEYKSSKKPTMLNGIREIGISKILENPRKNKYIKLEKIVKNAKMIPPPLGTGEECILLLLGISSNLEFERDINFLYNLLLIKNEAINIIG